MADAVFVGTNTGLAVLERNDGGFRRADDQFQGQPITSVVSDPADGLVYVGTRAGVLRSRDGGASGQALGEGLDRRAVAYAIDVAAGEGVAIEARTIILATGGADGLHRDEPDATTGDGYALALDAGVELANLEFTQFQPEPVFEGAEVAAALGPILRAIGPDGAAAEPLGRLAQAAPYLAPTAASARNGVTWSTGYAGGSAAPCTASSRRTSRVYSWPGSWRRARTAPARGQAPSPRTRCARRRRQRSARLS